MIPIIEYLYVTILLLISYKLIIYFNKSYKKKIYVKYKFYI